MKLTSTIWALSAAIFVCLPIAAQTQGRTAVRRTKESTNRQSDRQ